MGEERRFTWGPVAAAPGQDEELRRLGAELPSPTGDTIRGHIVEMQKHQRRDNEGGWKWSVGIYRDRGVRFTEAGAAHSSQEASDAANAAVPRVIARAQEHDERVVALEAILVPARKAGAGWAPPALPIEGRDLEFHRTLMWLAKEQAGGRPGLGLPTDTGLGKLIAALSAYLNASRR